MLGARLQKRTTQRPNCVVQHVAVPGLVLGEPSREHSQHLARVRNNRFATTGDKMSERTQCRLLHLSTTTQGPAPAIAPAQHRAHQVQPMERAVHYRGRRAIRHLLGVIQAGGKYHGKDLGQHRVLVHKVLCVLPQRPASCLADEWLQAEHARSTLHTGSHAQLSAQPWLHSYRKRGEKRHAPSGLALGREGTAAAGQSAPP